MALPVYSTIQMYLFIIYYFYSTYQRNFYHIFASIPLYDGSDGEGFFPWLECLEQHGSIVEEILKLKHWEDQLDQSRM